MSRKIYLVQSYTRTIPARLVKLATKYKYSHVSLCLDKKCDVMYSFGRKKLYNFLNGGFISEKRDGAFFKRFSDTVCRIYELEVTDEQYNKLYSKIEYMIENEDKYKYDTLGFVLRGFKIKVKFKDRYVCSQFVAQMLVDANVAEFDKDTAFVKPQDFDSLRGVKKIYEGRYLDYDILRAM